MSHRLEQLTSAIDRGVREVFSRGFSDPRIGGLITITGVRVLPDLSRAFVNVSVLPVEKEELTLHGLTAAAKHIRREVGDLVNTRTLPQLEFRLDRSIKKEASVLRDLDRVREDLKTRPPPPEVAAEQGPPPDASDAARDEELNDDSPDSPQDSAL